MKSLFKILSVCTLVAFSVFLFVHQKKQGALGPQRGPASVSSAQAGIEFLSLKELELLSPQDRYAYLRKTTSILVKASYLNGVFSKSKTKTAQDHQLLKLLVASAYARDLKVCSISGLHPIYVYADQTCRTAGSLVVKEGTANLFRSSDIQDREGKKHLVCPAGQSFCSPLLVGFRFDSEGKASLRCMNDISNEKCYKNMSTDAASMEKSFEVLNQASPALWSELSRGVQELCLENGRFKEDDEGCRYVRLQMRHNTKYYSSKLSSEYKDLAAKLEAENAQAGDQHACKQHQHEQESEIGLADHRNFNVPGQKIVMVSGRCWRLPHDTIVSRRLVRDTSTRQRRPDQDRFEFIVGDEVIFTQPVGGVGTEDDRVTNVRFYNFRCGPCSNAKNLSRCLFELRKPEDSRNSYEALEVNRAAPASSLEDCRQLISDFETREVPDVVFERVRSSGASALYEADSVE